MKVYLAMTEKSTDPEFVKIIPLKNGKNVFANIKDSDFSIELSKGKYLYIYGDLFYYLKNDGHIRIIGADSNSYLKKVFSENTLKDVISNLEGQYIGLCVDSSKNIVHVFSDRYSRNDSFYAYDGTDFYFATDLDFIFKHISPEYDQKMLAHLFCVYGWYTPKGLTIYKNVKQLKAGEIITLSGLGMHSETIKFKPLKIEDYTDKQLETYYKILRESVIARANHNGKTWISSSSGWDSSLLLGMLIHEFGSKNVDMITGTLEYSNETKVINKFEIKKIKKIGAYYGLKPNLISLDFKNKNASTYWEKLLPYYKSKHIYTYTTYTDAKFSDGLTNIAGRRQTVFNGETSDSFHNYGFSQFVTLFHTQKCFTEYADKMNCYLYGPSFFKKVIDGNHERDKVFQIFKKMMSNTEFASQWRDRKDLIESYLFPFFYGSPRIPFAKTFLNPALTKDGQNAIYHFPYKEYMPEILTNLSDMNMYSWFIYLYHSFHSQGSTVNVKKHSMELNNHFWRMPFNDYRLIEFLSKAPENWGRGLELNNTKYPLKWVARNKIKFPYELLEEGPHSYLYDVIEGFNLAAEITYRSGVTELFKDTLKSMPYKNILGDKYFDLAYLNKLCYDYLENKKVKGQDFNNLVSLITLCVTGWY